METKRMWHFELEYMDFKSEIYVPEDMSIMDFTQELRRGIGLRETEDTPYHLIFDKQGRVFMQDDSIAGFVDMLWEGGDDPDDPYKKKPIYHEDFYHPESKYTLRDLFPEIGDDILYKQDYDRVICTLKDITEDEDIRICSMPVKMSAKRFTGSNSGSASCETD